MIIRYTILKESTDISTVKLYLVKEERSIPEVAGMQEGRELLSHAESCRVVRRAVTKNLVWEEFFVWRTEKASNSVVNCPCHINHATKMSGACR